MTILKNNSVIDQICVALCSKHLGSIVIAMLRLPTSANTLKSLRTQEGDNDVRDEDDASENEDGEDGEEAKSGEEDDDEDEDGGDGTDALPRIHSETEKAKVDLLHRLNEWTPSSLAICEWCVMYKPRDADDLMPLLVKIQELIIAMDDEPCPDHQLPHAPEGWVITGPLRPLYKGMERRAALFSTLLAPNGSTNTVVNWPENPLGSAPCPECCVREVYGSRMSLDDLYVIGCLKRLGGLTKETAKEVSTLNSSLLWLRYR
jgi:hypothetical protein